MNNQTEPILIEYGCNKPKIYILLTLGGVFLLLAIVLFSYLYSISAYTSNSINDLAYDQTFIAYKPEKMTVFDYLSDFLAHGAGVLGVITDISFILGIVFLAFSAFTALQTWKSHISVTPQRIYGIGDFGKAYDIPTNSITMSERSIFGSIVIHNGENVIRFSNIQYNDIIVKTISQLLSSNIPPIIFPSTESSDLSQVTAPQSEAPQINEPTFISAPAPSYDPGIGSPDEYDDPNLS